MLQSVRARLTLWHAVALGVLLIAFAVASYASLDRVTRRRADRLLAQTADAFASELLAERADEPSDALAATEAVKEFRFGDIRLLVLDSSARVIAASLPVASAGRGGAPPAPLDLRRVERVVRARAAALPALFTLDEGAREFRAYATPVRLVGTPYIVVAMRPLDEERDMLAEVRLAMLIAIPLALALATASGYLLARRSLAPVAAMSAQAARIGAMNLHERLPVPNPRDELGQLAGVFNDLLARLHEAFDRQRHFMADASHELRTPVAVVRTEAGVALSAPHRDEAEYREALTIAHEESRRLTTIVDDLFLLARADAGENPLRPVELYLDEIVTESVRAVRTLAGQRHVEVRASVCGEAPYRGDEDMLRRLVLNLLDNAIKFSPSGARVSATLHSSDTEYCVRVRDTGPGISPEAQARVFERFFRVDPARTHDARAGAGGAGLGLAIARWIAEVHGGRLDLAHSSPAGSEFRLTLPRG